MKEKQNNIYFQKNQFCIEIEEKWSKFHDFANLRPDFGIFKTMFPSSNIYALKIQWLLTMDNCRLLSTYY